MTAQNSCSASCRVPRERLLEQKVSIMQVLMLRVWDVLPYAATFSVAEQKGVGGTELQLLMHARALKKLGHEVIVFGVTREDVIQEGVLFRGTRGKEHLLELLADEYQTADVVFVNTSAGLPRLRAVLPKAIIIEVCQNGPHFENDASIDIYAFVGLGQFAHYSSKYRKHRSKFMLLPNVPQWNSIYSKLSRSPSLDQIVWVGSVQKQGLRRWAKAMKLVMDRYKTVRWMLCSPSYDVATRDGFPVAFAGIDLQMSRIEFKNLPLLELAGEIARSKILLVSLGGEDGPVSYLDGHAAGVPVLSGDDICGKFFNPEGTGLRCSTVSDCVNAIEFLFENPEVRKKMGDMGRKLVANNFTEDNQNSALEQLMAYVELKRDQSFPIKNSVQSDEKFSATFWRERLEIKISTRLSSLHRKQHV